MTASEFTGLSRLSELFSWLNPDLGDCIIGIIGILAVVAVWRVIVG